MTEQTHDQLSTGLAELQRQCQGVWRIESYPVHGLYLAEIVADPTLRTALLVLAEAIDVADAGGGPRLCLTCDQPFGARATCWPASLVILRPDVAEPGGVVVQALCGACAGGEQAALERSIVRALSFYTGFAMRPVDTTSHAAGHA